MALALLASTVGCYLLGSVSFAFLFVKLFVGKDLRQEGTGNLGGRNVSRILGKGKAAAVIALDMGKGALAVWLTQRFVGSETWVLLLAMTMVLLGHNYSILMGFQGGKGLAAGFGALLVVNSTVLVVLVVAAVVVLAASHNVYKAAITMIIVFVPAIMYYHWGDYLSLLMALAAALVVMSRHMKHL